MHMLTRRQLLSQTGMGIGAMALQWMLHAEASATPPVLKLKPHNDLNLRQPHFEPRARAMISLFQHGGPSHMDMTDPKPELTKFHGTDYQGDIHFSFVNEASKKLLGSPFKFRKHGQCGTELSEILPHTASVVDDICLIRSMHTGANGHEVSIRYFHGGIPGILGRPTFGSWITYALGSETQDLPACMVLTDPGGHPVDGDDGYFVLHDGEGLVFAVTLDNVAAEQEAEFIVFFRQVDEVALEAGHGLGAVFFV